MRVVDMCFKFWSAWCIDLWMKWCVECVWLWTFWFNCKSVYVRENEFERLKLITSALRKSRLSLDLPIFRTSFSVLIPLDLFSNSKHFQIQKRQNFDKKIELQLQFCHMNGNLDQNISSTQAIVNAREKEKKPSMQKQISMPLRVAWDFTAFNASRGSST